MPYSFVVPTDYLIMNAPTKQIDSNKEDETETTNILLALIASMQEQKVDNLNRRNAILQDITGLSI